MAAARPFCKKLHKPELMYSTFDRDLLALYLGIRQFRYLLEGRHFIAFTDHKPLLFAMVKTTDPCSSRQCHPAFIEITTDIQHLPWRDNVVADCLSWKEDKGKADFKA